MLSTKTLFLLGTTLMTMSAQAVVCQVDMVRGNGRVIQPFTSHGLDQREACKEAQKACRLDLRQRQRNGSNIQASCQLVGVINTGPLPPMPNPGPTPNPNPYPPVGNYDYELDGIAQVLSSGGWRARQHAVADLVRYPSPRAIAMAVKALNDNDSDVKNAASRSVNELINLIDMNYDSIPVMQAVAPLLKNGGWKQRQAAAKVLGAVYTAEAVIPLIDALNDNDSDVKNMAQSSINKVIGNPDLKQVVRQNKQAFAQLAKSGGWKQRQQTIKVLGVAQVPRTIAIVVEATGDNDSDVSRAATNAMNSIVQARNYSSVNMNTIAKLDELYRTKGWKVRMNAVTALGATYNPAARPTVLRALDDNDSDVRRAAQNALRNL
jgi:HEAT repeat protein